MAKHKSVEEPGEDRPDEACSVDSPGSSSLNPRVNGCSTWMLAEQETLPDGTGSLQLYLGQNASRYRHWKRADESERVEILQTC